MDNSNCYWCDYPINLIGTEEEGYYCTFNPDKKEKCELQTPCVRYINKENVPEYIRHLIKEFKEIEQRLVKLP